MTDKPKTTANGRPRVQAQEVAEWLKMRAYGLTVGQIAKQTGRSRASITRWTSQAVKEETAAQPAKPKAKAKRRPRRPRRPRSPSRSRRRRSGRPTDEARGSGVIGRDGGSPRPTVVAAVAGFADCEVLTAEAATLMMLEKYGRGLPVASIPTGFALRVWRYVDRKTTRGTD